MKNQDKKNKSFWRRKSRKKNISPRIVIRNDFRYNYSNKARKHPHYVFAQEGNILFSVGVTHKPRTRGKDNIPLSINPDPTDKRKAYIRPVVMKEHKNKYGWQLVGWELCEEDLEKIKHLFEQ